MPRKKKVAAIFIRFLNRHEIDYEQAAI